MKKVFIGVMMAALVALGATALVAADLPQTLTGVNLSTAQVLTPDQAQQVRGAFQGGLQGWLEKFNNPPGANSQQGNHSNYYNADSNANNYHPYYYPQYSRAFKFSDD